MDGVKWIWYLSPMRAAKVQASLRIRTVSPEPPLLTHTSSESRGTFRQKASSLAPLNGWACAVKICHDGMLEDTNSLDGAHMWNLTIYTEFNCQELRLQYNSSIVLRDAETENILPSITALFLSHSHQTFYLLGFWPLRLAVSLDRDLLVQIMNHPTVT